MLVDDAIQNAVAERLKSDPDLQLKAAKNIARILEENGVTPPSDDVVQRDLSHPGTLLTAGSNRVTCHVNIFGFVIYLPDKVIKDLSRENDIPGAFMAAGAGTIVASGGTVAPLIPAIAAYLALEFWLIEKLNHGRGVNLTIVWVLPGVIVPTAA